MYNFSRYHTLENSVHEGSVGDKRTCSAHVCNEGTGHWTCRAQERLSDSCVSDAQEIRVEFDLAVSHHNISHQQTCFHTSLSDIVSSTQFILTSFQFKIRHFKKCFKGERIKEEKHIFFYRVKEIFRTFKPKKQEAPLHSWLFPQPDGNGRRRPRSLYTGLSTVPCAGNLRPRCT